MPLSSIPQPDIRRARIFRNGRNQAVRIPKEFEFASREVFIRQDGDQLVLEPINHSTGLLATLQSLRSLSETLPDSDRDLPPLDDVEF
jgi:antitoxin VapB